MSKYIDVEAAKKVITDYGKGEISDGAKCLDCVDDILALANAMDWLPAADVVPVVHGVWKSVKNPRWPAYSHDKCNICGWWNTKNALCYDEDRKPGHYLNYCPNCGAMMRPEVHGSDEEVEE